MPCSCAASSASAICRAMSSASSSAITGGAQSRVSERLALDELHDQRVHAATLLDAVNLRDVRMIERREDVRLTLEAGHAISVGGERGQAGS